MGQVITVSVYLLALIGLGLFMLRILTKLKNSKREFFVVFLFCALIYGLGILFQTMATTVDGAILSLRLSSLGGFLMPPVLFLYAQKYCEYRVSKWINITVFASAFLLIALMWTTEWHNLIYTSIHLRSLVVGIGGLHWDVSHGVLFPLVIIYPVMCLAFTVMILVWDFRRSDVVRRKRLWPLILCAVIPAIVQGAVILNMTHDVDAHLYTIFIALICAGIAHRKSFNYYLAESEESHRLQKIVRNAISNISHDIKTPLTVLSISLEKLLDVSPDDPEYFRDIRIAYNKSLDLQRLIKNMIEITRIDAVQDMFKPEWISLNSVLSDVQEKYGDYLESLGLSLDVFGSGKDVFVYLDTSLIWSVFDNIIYNAVRHTKNGGVTAVAKMAEETVTVTVSDTGCGIASEHLEHIFDRFYKVEMSRGGTGATAGDSGLGLFIVKKIMEGIGGQVQIESEIGVGTSILLTFQKKEI